MNSAIVDILAPYHISSLHIFKGSPPRQAFHFIRYGDMLQSLKTLIRVMRHRGEILRAGSYYNAGLHAQGMGDYKKARIAYERCLALQPNHEPAHVNLGAILTREGEYADAEVHFKRAIEVRPNLHRPYYNLGLLYQLTDREDQAIEMFQKTLAYKDDHQWASMALAEIYTNRKEYERAIDQFEKALETTRDPHDLHVKISELYYFQGDYESAEDHLRQAMAFRAQAETYYNLAWLLTVQGNDLEECIQMLELAEQTRAGYKDALYNLAFAQSMGNQFEASIATMKRYVSLYSKDTPTEVIKRLEYLYQANHANLLARLTISKILVDLGQLEEATNRTQDLTSQHPDYLPAFEYLAELYKLQGNHRKAIQTYHRLIDIAPAYINGYLGLSKAYGSVENYTAALPIVEKVLQLDPENAGLQYQYATLMAQQGELETAAKHYRMVATLDPDYPQIQKRIRMLEEELRESRDRIRTLY